MSEIWNFSPSLKDEVQRCISLARIDVKNKWYKEFGHLTLNHHDVQMFTREKVIESTIEILSQNDYVEARVDVEDEEVPKTMDRSEAASESVEEIVENLETEFVNRVDFVIEECMKNCSLLHTLASKLSIPTIEKLCKHICDKTDITEDFILQYFKHFLPNYIKRSYNSSSLDILVVSYKKFPLQFKLLLVTLIKDSEILNQVLKDFVKLLDEDEQSNILMNLSETELTSQEFLDNIFSIYTAYKDCKKSECIQIYVQSLIVQYYSICTTDRNFGRLLLTFLQTHKYLKMSLNSNNIEKVLETNRSPFKRPCLLLLKELNGEDDNNKSLSEDSE